MMATKPSAGQCSRTMIQLLLDNQNTNKERPQKHKVRPASLEDAWFLRCRRSGLSCHACDAQVPFDLLVAHVEVGSCLRPVPGAVCSA